MSLIVIVVDIFSIDAQIWIKTQEHFCHKIFINRGDSASVNVSVSNGVIVVVVVVAISLSEIP